MLQPPKNDAMRGVVRLVARDQERQITWLIADITSEVAITANQFLTFCRFHGNLVDI